ncbi:MAG: toxin-antitoxin system TumE family protein, partial [Gammaproteobacteria bacterium]
MLVIDRKVVFPDGAIVPMVIWRLPEADIERPHRFKYRFYYGLSDGTCVVRYDNERGKGDHRHWGDREEPCRFVDIETLIADFLNDVAKARGVNGEKDKHRCRIG